MLKQLTLGLIAVFVTATKAKPSNTNQIPFKFEAYPPLGYASSRKPWASIPTYARPYASLSHLIPNQLTTTWASIATPTDSAAIYGNYAWSQQWVAINVTKPTITTTVSATAVPKSELVQPTALPFMPIGISATSPTFPSDFTWGFAGAALQIEGAINIEGRGPSITEVIIQGLEKAPGGGVPDISNLNYYLYKQDIARLAALGIRSYSFSISWSRILPFAKPGSPVNEEGIAHYNDLIDTILEYGMEPIATLNHFDTPLYYLTNTSWQGWDHPEFLDGFENYAKIVLTHYADRVGTWITFNEPTTDGLRVRNWGSGYNIVMGHARVVNWYRKYIGGSARWSLKLSFGYGGVPLPLDPSSTEDGIAANRYMDFAIGYIAHPLFLGLPPPESVRSALGATVANYTAADLAAANGTCDFLGFDLYSVGYQTSPQAGIAACAQNSSDPSFPVCTTYSNTRAGWDAGAMGLGGETAYQHYREVFAFLSHRYPSNGGMMITETGWAPFGASTMTVDEAQVDLSQSTYYVSLFAEVLKAIAQDGHKIIGVLGWSFVDNWEWGSYTPHYGVQGFNSTTLERYYKRSIFDFTNFFKDHGAQ